MTRYSRLSPSKRGYGSAWQKLRLAHLAKQPLCQFCIKLGNTVAAGVVDHIKPHKGNAALLMDATNLQSLCAPCHDRHKQSQERTGSLKGADIYGLPLDKNHHWNQ